MAPAQEFKVNSVNPHHHYDQFRQYASVSVQNMNSDPAANPRIRQPVVMYTLFTHEKLKTGDIIRIAPDSELREVYGRHSTFFIYQPETTLSAYFNIRGQVPYESAEGQKLYQAERAPLKNAAGKMQPGYEPQLCQIFSTLDFQPGDLMAVKLVEEKKARDGSTLRYFQDEKYKKILSDSIRNFCAGV